MTKITVLLLGTTLLMLSCSSGEGEVKSQMKATVKQPVKTTRELVKEEPLMQDTFSLDYIMGKFVPAKAEGFVQVRVEHADREGLYLRTDTYEAFQRMYAAAKADGITLQIRSATRNFANQKRIWEAKWTGKRILSSGENAAKAFPDPKERAIKILEYSSMPGTSRHHWGTDIDLNAFNNAYFEKGKGLQIYQWLLAHAAEYGFCQSYTAKGDNRPYGYNEEKWHWSYLPVAKILTQKAKVMLQNKSISGFKGAETAEAIDIVQKYVLGINQACL